jgi:2-dehydropantoate 2-reductase
MASMLRDIEAGLPAEGDHILGDLRRGAVEPDAPALLRIADLHVRAYEARRTRSVTSGD